LALINHELAQIGTWVLSVTIEFWLVFCSKLFHIICQTSSSVKNTYFHLNVSNKICFAVFFSASLIESHISNLAPEMRYNRHPRWHQFKSSPPYNIPFTIYKITYWFGWHPQVYSGLAVVLQVFSCTRIISLYFSNFSRCKRFQTIIENKQWRNALNWNDRNPTIWVL
jgi:hypothetical protein